MQNMNTINIPEPVHQILNRLEQNGHEAYVVGGCVRDAILGRTPHDWDITTSATPPEMKMALAGYRTWDTGIKHGTITVLAEHTAYEVTTYRTDGSYSDGRHPDAVHFVTNITEDLARRDFTINAIAYHPDRGFVDPFGGFSDCKAGILRCVGVSKERFQEDGLRILRALRFAGRYGFVVAPETEMAMFTEKEQLYRISAERIQSELMQILSTDASWKILSQYREIIEIFIPEISGMVGFEQKNQYHIYDVLEHTLQAFQIASATSADPIIRLTILFHDIGKPHCFTEDPDGTRHFHGHGSTSEQITREIMRRLKFDNKTTHAVAELVRYHDCTIETTRKSIKRWLNKIGKEQFERLLIIRLADISAQNPKYLPARKEKLKKIEEIFHEIIEKDQCFALKDMQLNGRDLIILGMKPGKELGVVLNRIFSLVLDGQLENRKDVLIEYAKSLITEHNVTGEGDIWNQNRTEKAEENPVSIDEF